MGKAKHTGRTRDGRRLCAGTAKSTGGPCEAFALRDSDVCWVHGGATPKGFAAPQTKTGRYSKHLPTRLAARYEEAQADGKLLELRDEVSLIDSRLADLLSRVDTGESGAIYKALKATYAELEKASAKADGPAMAAAIRELGVLINRGMADWAIWAEIAAGVEQRRKLVETERKHLAQMEQMVTVNEMMLMAGALLASVRAHVSDRHALNAISTEFARLTAAG